MVKNIDLEKILEQNPHIDPELLNQALELVQKLKELGLKGSRYNLVSPYARRRVGATETSKGPSRIANVGRRARI
jgi:hypothetical protein